MVADKDLLEANAFNRARLTSAFSHGTPTGDEVELGQPGRIVLAGAVLAGLLIAGAAAAALSHSTSDDGADQTSGLGVPIPAVGAGAEQLQGVADIDVAVLLGNGVGPPLDRGALDLDGATAPTADQVVVVSLAAGPVRRFAGVSHQDVGRPRVDQ